MTGKKKTDTSPLGVPLGDLLLLLHPTSIKASLEGTTLIARHEHYTIRIEVVPPENRGSENGPIRAVVRVTSELPSQVIEFFKEPEAMVGMNVFAVLGALTFDRGKVYIGSRLTIYEAEDAWHALHLPLLFHNHLWHRSHSRSNASDIQEGRPTRRSVPKGISNRSKATCHSYVSALLAVWALRQNLGWQQEPRALWQAITEQPYSRWLLTSRIPSSEAACSVCCSCPTNSRITSAFSSSAFNSTTWKWPQMTSRRTSAPGVKVS